MSELYSMLKAKKTGASSGGGGGATVNNATITIQKNGTTVDSFTSNQATDKTINITVPTSAADVLALPDTTKYAAALSLTINSSTFVMTGQLKDQNGDNLGTAQTIDLPLESVVVNGSYNSQTKKVVLTLQNGNTIEFSVADLVSGLQTELSASNKLNPAYINYDSTHRAVSDTEKSTWNGKQNAIDSSHKLSADLVDDTSATNKFATAAELEQIETNKNNISTVQTSLEVGQNDDGKVLTATYSGGTGTYSWVTPSGGGGTSDYTDLTNKPQINSVTLSGNKSLNDLGIAAAADIPSVPITEIQKNSTTISPVSGVVNITVPTTAADVSAIPTSAKGTASGVAELDSNGKVPSSQLPSYVDDVIEGYYYNSKFYEDSAHTTEITGTTGKIYVDLSTNKTYRWSGSGYTEISESLALGTTSSTAFRGDYGSTAYTHATDSSRSTTAKSSGLYKIASTAQGHIASLTSVQKSDITALGIPAQDTTYNAATTTTDGLMSAQDKVDLGNCQNNISSLTPTVLKDGFTLSTTWRELPELRITIPANTICRVSAMQTFNSADPTGLILSYGDTDANRESLSNLWAKTENTAGGTVSLETSAIIDNSTSNNRTLYVWATAKVSGTNYVCAVYEKLA